MLELVNGARRVGGRGPRQRAPRLSRCGGLQFFVAGDSARDSAHHVQTVEGRNAWTSLAQFDAGIRQIETVGRCANGHAQQQPLRAAAIGARFEVGGHTLARLVRQQWIFTHLLREDALGETRHEHHAERASACLFREADEHAAVPIRGWLHSDGAKAIRENLTYFSKSDRSNSAHGAQLRENPLDDDWLPNHARDELLQRVQPLPPGGGVGPFIELADERQREPAQVFEVSQIAFDAGHLRRVRIVAARFPQPKPILRGEPIQAHPPIASGDDRGFEEPLLPAIRCAHDAMNDRCVGRFVRRRDEIGLGQRLVRHGGSIGRRRERIIDGLRRRVILKERGLRWPGSPRRRRFDSRSHRVGHLCQRQVLREAMR